MTQRKEIFDLAPLYALDALEQDERHLVEGALASDSALRLEVDAFREVAAQLAQAVETAPSTPSASVWERIHAEATGESVNRRPQLALPTELRRYRRWTLLTAAESVAAVVVSLGLGARVLDLQDRMRAGDSIDELASTAVTRDGSRLVELGAQEGFEGARATIVLTEEGTGYLLSDTLPELNPDRTYQLWVVVRAGDEQRVVSAGVLGPDPGISQFSAVGEVEAFAITEEVAGGVVVAEGPTVLVGSVGT